MKSVRHAAMQGLQLRSVASSSAAPCLAGSGRSFGGYANAQKTSRSVPTGRTPHKVNWYRENNNLLGYKKGVESMIYDREHQLLPSQAQGPAPQVRPPHKAAGIQAMRLPVFGFSRGLPADARHVWNKVALHQGDAARLECDVLVHSTLPLPGLSPDGTLDVRPGVVAATAGPRYVEALRGLGAMSAGSVVATEGFNLPAESVFHVALPMNESEQALAQAYTQCLDMLVAKGLKSIAMPCIGTGIHGYAQFTAANVATRTVCEWLSKAENFGRVERVVFCCHLEEDWQIYLQLIHANMNRAVQAPAAPAV